MKKREIFKIEGDKITRQRRHCPKCGEGVFLGEHKDRSSCGLCGYTEFKSGGKKPEKPSKEEKTDENIKQPAKESKIKDNDQVSEEKTTPKTETEEKPQELSEETKHE